MCTPTRAALMTGRYPFRYGPQTAVIPSGHTYGLPTDEWLLPQALNAAGYQTAIIGKWHLGHADRTFWPRQRGFDYQYGPLIGEIDYFTHEQLVAIMMTQTRPGPRSASTARSSGMPSIRRSRTDPPAEARAAEGPCIGMAWAEPMAV